MRHFKGDKVRFNVPFAEDVPKDTLGRVDSVRYDYVMVVAKGRRWMCKHHEVRNAGTYPEVTIEMLRQLHADEDLLRDFEKWEQRNATR